MNCADVRARLPLLLYGDLPANEAEEVRQHLARCPACQGEQTTLIQLRRLLAAVPEPAATVDLPRLYRDAAESQGRRLRRWRRIATAAVAAAAVVFLALFLSRLEVRLDNHQLVLRWGDVPPQPEVPVPPTPPPQPEPPVITLSPPATTADIEDRLRLLSELVQELSNDADRREVRRLEEMARLRTQVQNLQQQLIEQRLATEKDVAALYSAQSSDKQKGASP
jgi:hypothetical protein